MVSAALALPSVDRMTRAEAEACRDEIQRHLKSARRLLLQLYERGGWFALGYETWRQCIQHEFGFSTSFAYRQLNAAISERCISPHGEFGVIPEAHLRPLAAVPEEERGVVWNIAASTAPAGKITQAHVRSAVDVYQEVKTTGTVETPEGQQIPLKSAVAQDITIAVMNQTIERLERRISHMVRQKKVFETSGKVFPAIGGAQVVIISLDKPWTLERGKKYLFKVYEQIVSEEEETDGES